MGNRSTSRTALLLALLLCPACGTTEEPPAAEPAALPAPTSLAALPESSGVAFPHWNIPVKAGARVWSYPTVPIEERYGKAITIEPDLIVGGDASDPRTLFYRPNDVAVDEQGRMYVLDHGNNRVQVFAPDGSFVRQIGREGQGPGEFTNGSELEIAGDRLLLWDRGKRRLVTWDLEGNPGDEISLAGVGVITAIDMAGDSLLLVTRTEVPGALEAGTRLDFIVQLFGIDGAAGPVLLRLQSIWPTSGGAPKPSSASGATGDVYVTTAAEYQVHSFTDEGAPRWALRMNWQRRSTDEDRERTREFLPERYPQYSGEGLDRLLDQSYPRPYYDALGGIYIDGHGHVYVRPSVADTEQNRELGRTIGDDHAWPVDVYNAAGEHLFSGAMPQSSWLEARGDHVYYFTTNLATEERTLVRAVLREPF